MLGKVTAALVGAVVLMGSVEAQAALPKTLVYTGVMNDAKGSPVGGIYWMRFGLHRDKEDQKQLWFEEVYVAVDKGSYQVELGKQRPIPQAVELTSLFLSIQVDGTEIQRVPVDATMVSPGTTTGAEGTGASGAGGGAGTCAQCANADNANKLEGMSFKQLVETAAKKGIRVGATAHFTSAVGSGEGTPFRLTCPPGFVVTGIKGKAGDSIGNLQLVCSPMEVE